MLQKIATPVADVFITQELVRRPPRKTDFLQEKQALQDLAARMVDQPEDVLPRFVELAMEMTGGVSGGLSLYEPEPSPGVFRWKYVHGILSPFEAATTPRDFSPCGITLDQNAPVLSLHPERVYDWIADANIVVPEVLLVPLYISGREPLGTLWIVSEHEGHFDSGHARVLAELATFVGMALRMVRSEEQLQRALRAQETLTGEMSHRVKNLFAMTDSLVRMSARSAGSKDEYVNVLSGRLSALDRANGLVRRTFGEHGSDSGGSELAALTRTIVQPYEHAGPANASRFRIYGPIIQCGERATNSVALILHELTTNAAKYGALKSDSGQVDVQWREDDDNLVLTWIERGGPPVVAPPTQKGFGSVLVENTVVQQFGGALDYQWHSDGLSVVIKIPATALSS